MEKPRYENFDEWLKDFTRFQEHPNDEDFLKALNTRTNNSSKELKQEVQMYLQNRMLEANPFEVFGRVMKEIGTGYQLVIKHPDDPWFNV